MPCPFQHRLCEIFLYKMLDYLYSFESHIQYQDFGLCYVKIVPSNALYPPLFSHCALGDSRTSFTATTEQS